MLFYDPQTRIISIHKTYFMVDDNGQVQVQKGESLRPYPSQQVGQWLRDVFRQANGRKVWQICIDCRGFLDLFTEGRLAYRDTSLYSGDRPVTVQYVGLGDVDPNPDIPILWGVQLDGFELPSLRVWPDFNAKVGWLGDDGVLYLVPMGTVHTTG